MRIYAFRDPLRGAPRKQRVDQTVAGLGDFLIGKSQPPPAVCIIGELAITHHMGSRDVPGTGGIRLQHDPLLGRKHCIGSQYCACRSCVSGRNEVGMRALRLITRQPKHLGPERGETEIPGRNPLFGQLGQVSLHHSKRLLIGLTDNRAVAYSKTQ
jgi:hypothetical protein